MSDELDQQRLERYRELADEPYLGEVDPSVEPYVRATIDGGVNPAWYYHTYNGMFHAPERRDLDEVDLACVGIPMDLGTPNQRSGSRLGPRELRTWSINQGPKNAETGVNPFELCRVADWGDVRLQRNPYDLETNIEELTDVYRAFRDADVVPLSIGGEHTITYPILRALGEEEPLGLVHLDSHPDTRTGSYQGAPVNDGNLFTEAVCDGVIDPERSIQIGLRGRALLVSKFAEETGMTTVPATEFQERGVEDVLAEALDVIGDRPYYLTVDTDVFDPSAMPGTTLPEPFGLTGREVRDFLRGLRGTNLVGADLVELSPNYDRTGQSGCLAAGIAFEQLCLLGEARAQRAGEQRLTEWEEPPVSPRAR
ncbi:MAG: arginase family protein [Halolamina sp.]